MLYAQHRRSAYEVVPSDDERSHSPYHPHRVTCQHAQHPANLLASTAQAGGGSQPSVTQPAASRRPRRRHSSRHRKKTRLQVRLPVSSSHPTSIASPPASHSRHNESFGVEAEAEMEMGARYNPVFGIIEHGEAAAPYIETTCVNGGSADSQDDGSYSSGSSTVSRDNDDENDKLLDQRGLEELEQYELDDTLGDMMPIAFGRRRRREGVFSSSASGSTQRGGSWDVNEMMMARGTLDRLTSSGGEEKPSSEDEEVLIDEERGIRKYVRLIAPHIGLVVLTCSYTLIGATLFYSLENPNETRTKRRLLNMIYARQEEFRELTSLANNYMNDMSDQLFLSFEKQGLTSREVKLNDTIEVWTFTTSVFFSVTVLTTIGYGNPVPITRLGQIICVSFSLIGIPLTLVTIADMGKFLSEHLIFVYGKYLRCKHYLLRRVERRHPTECLTQREHVCEQCQDRGLTEHMQIIEEQKIPAMLVLGILVLYTALGGVLMSKLETWSFFTSFYWSFITMTTVGFGDLMPRRDQYILVILLYIVLGLAITTMCIDLVGIQYIRKIHYFGRKIQDARSALAVVGGKVVLVSELYASLMQKRAKNNARDAFIIDNLFISKHIIPFIPSDIRRIKYIDQVEVAKSRHNSVANLELSNSCRFCHSKLAGVDTTPHHHHHRSPSKAFNGGRLT